VQEAAVVARPEPFRAMLEQAFEAEGIRPTPVLVPSAGPPPLEPIGLERRLDQLMLAGGVTPPRGLRVPALRREVPLRLEPPAPVMAAAPAAMPPVSASTERLLQALADEVVDADALGAEIIAGPNTEPGAREESGARDRPHAADPPLAAPFDSDLDVTRKLERPAAVEAALQDTLAAEATREWPIQRGPTQLASSRSAPAEDAPAPAPAPPGARKELPRPPPLPGRGKPPAARLTAARPAAAPAPAVVPVSPTAAPTALAVPAPIAIAVAAPPARPITVTGVSAPPPRVMQFLSDDTMPGTSPISSPGSALGSHPGSSPSGRGLVSQSELYRLQLEFEDTPARPLPALASLHPLPIPSMLDEALERAKVISSEGPALVDAVELGEAIGLAGVESTDLNRLDELEGIEDLDSLARALGLKSVCDSSIPSGDGAPVRLDDEPADELPPEAPVRELNAAEVSAIRRAAIMAALGDGKETVFASGEGPAVGPRPALAASSAAVPVIVRIPARPKVSAEAREQARRLYLSALEELGKGDKTGAVGHLKLAIHYDDGVQLYQDLLAQLEKTSKTDEQPVADTAEDPPALLVLKASGRLTTPRSEWGPERRR
jgi:hypothetical protein